MAVRLEKGRTKDTGPQNCSALVFSEFCPIEFPLFSKGTLELQGSSKELAGCGQIVKMVAATAGSNHLTDHDFDPARWIPLNPTDLPRQMRSAAR
ncbi:hypothetical protein E2320_007283 [Naja naja]|nr:hypothetical protein E2320_007283 [Naja naja]